MKPLFWIVPLVIGLSQGPKLTSISTLWFKRDSGYAFAYRPEEVVLALPSESLFTPKVRDIQWSPDGMALIATGEAIPKTVGEVLAASDGTPWFGMSWNPATKKQLTFVNGLKQILTIDWIPNSHLALISAVHVVEVNGGSKDVVQSALVDVLNPTNTKFVFQYDPNSTSAWEADCSPSQPIYRVSQTEGAMAGERAAAIAAQGISAEPVSGTPPAAVPMPGPPATNPDVKRWVQLYGIQGALGPKFLLEPAEEFTWLSTGAPGTCKVVRDRVARKTNTLFFALDPATGKRTSVVEPKQAMSDQAATKVRLETIERPSTTDFERNMVSGKSLWLSFVNAPKQMAGLLSFDGKSGSISPDTKWVAYITTGQVQLRRLVRLDPDAFRKAFRDYSASRAKQVGLSMIMYANDYDDTFMVANDSMDSLTPYMQDPDLMAGFVLTLKNRTIPDNQAATTQLGYLPTLGGRIIVWGDGHTSFEGV